MRTTTYEAGTATWSGSLVPVTGAPWTWQWNVSSVGTVRSPIGGGAAGREPTSLDGRVRAHSAEPVDERTSVLNWIYAGVDITFSQSVKIGSPVYATRDLTLTNSSKISGAAKKIAVGRNLTLSTNQNRIGLLGGSDPRLASAHVVGLCSTKGNVTLHQCGGSATATAWESDSVFATNVSHSVAGLITIHRR